MTIRSTTPPGPLAILETCLYVDDLDQAEQFYGNVLGLELVSRQAGRHLFFRCGSSMLLLFLPTASRESTTDVPAHGALGPGHVAFRVDQPALPAWQSHLTEHGVTLERIVDWPGPARSIYFRDPAGNSLEFATPQLWNPATSRP